MLGLSGSTLDAACISGGILPTAVKPESPDLSYIYMRHKVLTYILDYACHRLTSFRNDDYMRIST